MAKRVFLSIVAGALMVVLGATGGAVATDIHREPWRDQSRALVLDAYEYNEIDWQELVTDRRIAGFIGKATDGLPPRYSCRGEIDKTAFHLCRLAWRRYSMSKELYHTRRAIARALGLKWGAYHLARAGNPIRQADHFIDFTRPAPDDLIALDIEDNNPREFLSLADAEIFVRRVHQRLGRYPVLYTNGSTAKHIAANRDRYPLLSRLKLWYARYKPDIAMHFPKGHWQSYTLWQFVSHINCNRRRCPYTVPGTNRDIDVNVSPLTIAELRRQWPFDGLEPVRATPPMMLAETPLPSTRSDTDGSAPIMVPVTFDVTRDVGDFLDLDGTAERFATLEDIARGYRQRLEDRPSGRPSADTALHTASVGRNVAGRILRQSAGPR